MLVEDAVCQHSRGGGGGGGEGTESSHDWISWVTAVVCIVLYCCTGRLLRFQDWTPFALLASDCGVAAEAVEGGSEE